MDIRTGIIPHSSVVTKDFFTQKLDEDLGNNELRKRAEKEAIILALTDIGTKLSSYLNQ